MLTPHQQRARRHTVATSAINSFALDVYSRLASRQGNLFFSPFGIHEALGLAFAGSGAHTAQQLANVDHPFIFTICANSPHYRAPMLLFMGRVMDPTAA